MKFVRYLQSQIVPEWRDMYTDYLYLKGILKHIGQLVESPQCHMKRIPSFRSLNLCQNLNMEHAGSLHCDEELISIRLPLETEEHGSFHTSFFGTGPYAELERTFFRALDTELSKVHNFYKEKEVELLNRANELDRQLEALYYAKLRFNSSKKCMTKCMDDGNCSDSINMEIVKGKTIQELRKPNLVETTVEVVEHGEFSTLHFRKHHCPDTASEESSTKNFMMKVPPISPATTVLSIANDNANNSIRLLNIDKVQKAEEILRKAFIEFYHGLVLLGNYSSLNTSILTKILKKYDQITGRRLSKHYLKGIDGSTIHMADGVVRLIDRSKWVFAEHFTNSNYDKAVKLLQPVQRKGRHSTTYFLGIFSGCSIAVLVILIPRLALRRIHKSSYTSDYMEAVFPIYSMIFAVLLHIYLYGANLYMWKKTGVNYAFVFNFKRREMFESCDVFLIATGLTTLALGSMVLHLDVDASKSTFNESIPMVIVLIYVLLLLLPFNVLHRSGRFTFLRCLLHCFCAPLYKAVFVDMYLAEQISSQVLALRHFEYFLCYYGGGHFRERNSTACTENQLFENISFFLALLPFWWCCIQCARRWYDDQDNFWAYNSLKYFSTILAVAFRLTYINNRNSILWLSLTVISSAVATTASIYWDIVADWGLLERKSKNPWLRDKLALSYRSVYYILMVINVILRFVWLQSLLRLDIPRINPKAEDLVVALLEVFRRGIWNYFRVEYEHVINMEKFRVIKSTSLPFV